MIQLEKKYKIEKAVCDPDVRENLSEPFFTGNHIYATDGTILAVVPVKSDKEDIKGRLNGKLIAEFKKEVKHFTHIQFSATTNMLHPYSQKSGPRPEATLAPTIGRLLKEGKNGKPGTKSATLLIDPWKLVQLAESLGVEKNKYKAGVKLHLHIDEDNIVDDAIYVEPQDKSNKAYGLIMPRKK